MPRSTTSHAWLGLVGVLLTTPANAKNAGIFYSTLYAKTVEPELISGFAGSAKHWFLHDVDGDGRDDAVAHFRRGQRSEWRVALSTGKGFQPPRQVGSFPAPGADGAVLLGDVNGDSRADACHVSTIDGRWYVGFATAGPRFANPVVAGSKPIKRADQHFLADVNRDGRHDAVSVTTVGRRRKWFVALSSGDGFQSFRPLLRNFGRGADQCFMADVNGDRRVDAIAYYRRRGQWRVALAEGDGFANEVEWRRGFGDVDHDGGGFAFLRDVDADGKADAGFHLFGVWWVSYSQGDSFGPGSQRWISGLGQRTLGESRKKQNPPPVVASLTGSITGGKACVCTVDGAGRWFVASNPRRNATLFMERENTWVSWRCSYLPQVPGHEGTYDSGDPAVQATQLKMIHDAGFTYVMLDITNGRQPWVDKRAKSMFDRVREWNRNLQPGQREMYASVALGRTRGVEGEDPFFRKLNLECQRAWREFYTPYKDIYYCLNGKPLVVHMISNGIRDGFYQRIDDWNRGDRSFIDRVTCRWMTGWGGCTAERPNFYGWDVREKFGNPIHKEMMPVMPGFWNGGNYVGRDNGDFYRSQWVRVLQHQPDSVWLNSYNETWEHTSVEPSYMFNTRGPHKGIKMWTDLHGDRMDDFYWLMTCQYMRLYMEDTLAEGTYVQEQTDAGRSTGPLYRVEAGGFVPQPGPPRRAPVLLVPRGFTKSFSGRISEPAPYPADRARAGVSSRN